MILTNKMYLAFYIFWAVFFDQAYTAPVIHRRSVDSCIDRRSVTKVITDSCMNSSGTSATLSLSMSAAIAASRQKAPIIKQELQRLKSYFNDILDISNKTQELYGIKQQFCHDLIEELEAQKLGLISDFKCQWIKYYTGMEADVKKNVTVSQVGHFEMSIQQNIRLHILTQLAIFTKYMGSQECDESYDGIRANLTQMKDNLNKALCSLTKLIEPATISKIETYVDPDYIKHLEVLKKENESYKRAFVMFELKVLSQTLSTYAINETDITLKNETLSIVHC